MRTNLQGDRCGACPHVDRNDHRCGTRFSLGRLEQAFTVCFGAFHGCPMYHRINAEATRPAERRTAAIAITVRGHELPLPLRATGT